LVFADSGGDLGRNASCTAWTSHRELLCGRRLDNGEDWIECVTFIGSEQIEAVCVNGPARSGIVLGEEDMTALVIRDPSGNGPSQPPAAVLLVVIGLSYQNWNRPVVGAQFDSKRTFSSSFT
jgi:hypothetical protein